MKMKTIIAKRVSYGRKDTPVADREYKINGTGPVGTKKEWREWAKGKVKIKFVECKK